MRLSSDKKNNQTNNILSRASLALLREAIHDTGRELNQINIELYDTHLMLSNSLHPTLWIMLDNIAEFKAKTDTELTGNKQKEKVERTGTAP